MNHPIFTTELINKFKSFKTPFYYYDLKHLSQTLKKVNDNAGKYGYIVHYALKANANDKIIGLIKDAGMGADCVSGNEVTWKN
jgi:diaminopimelate decarboxylase